MNDVLLSTIEKITQIICNELKLDTIDIRDNLINAGVDSLTFINIIIKLEDYFDVEFPHEKLSIRESNSILKLSETVECLLHTRMDV